MAVQGLTPGQYQCWVDIAEFIRDNGYSPTVTNLMEKANATSRSTMQSRIDALKRNELIDTVDHLPRSISMRRWPPEVAAPQGARGSA